MVMPGGLVHIPVRIQKILSEGPNFDNDFLDDEGRENRNTTISGLSFFFFVS